MKTFYGASLLLSYFAPALAEVIEPAVALIDLSVEDQELLEGGVIDTSDVILEGTSDITLVPEPLASTNDLADKPPGKWTDEQKLTLETFKEIVATDIENVWVVAYIDPRCRDCLVLSLEWEKLTQIEEREKRKIKLGYVDISVEENWKIIQDHTKGRKMTQTPAVTLYGQDKQKPYWYSKENSSPSADGVHKWASSYADYYGYGYWDPEKYPGAAVYPHGPADGYNRHGYGIGQRAHYDSKYHDGALSKLGVHGGKGGKGYLTDGKWQSGDQVTQIKANQDETIMRRRTVTKGGKLSGAAHEASKEQTIGAGLTYEQRLAQAKQKQGYGSRPKYQSRPLPYTKGAAPAGAYGRQGYGYGRQGYGYGRQSAGYGRQSYGYGRQNPAYGGRQVYGSKQAYGRAGYGAIGYGTAGYGAAGYGRAGYGKTSYGRQGYGKAGYNGSYYGGKSYGQQHQYGARGYGGQNGYYGQRAGSYTGSYNAPGVPFTNKGRFGNPNTKYYGPGSQYLMQSAKDFKTKYDPVLGKGIVLGKYTRTLGDSKKVTDYDEKEIAGPDSQAYKDAYQLALRSGKGETDIFLAPEEMVQAIIAEDSPNLTTVKKEVVVPTVAEVELGAEAKTVDGQQH